MKSVTHVAGLFCDPCARPHAANCAPRLHRAQRVHGIHARVPRASRASSMRRVNTAMARSVNAVTVELKDRVRGRTGRTRTVQLLGASERTRRRVLWDTSRTPAIE